MEGEGLPFLSPFNTYTINSPPYMYYSKIKLGKFLFIFHLFSIVFIFYCVDL